MKELVFLIIGLVIGRYAIAQTVSELVNQNATQLKYLTQQIAALREYSAVLKEGYELVDIGLDTIANIKVADLAIHADYFNSLERVSPTVATDPRISMIRMYCKNTVAICDFLPGWNAKLGATIASNLESACQQDETWLATILMNCELQLQDSQRLALIGALYEHAKARYGFTAHLLIEFVDSQKQPS